MVLSFHETLVPRSPPPIQGGGGYKYYLLCAILSGFVGTLIFFKFRHDRANDAAIAARERLERRALHNRPRPRFFDAYVAAEKVRSGWEWEAMMPLTVSSLDASVAQTSEEEGIPARARVAVLLRMPGGINADIPYLELGTLEFAVLDLSRPTSSLYKQPVAVHQSGAFAD